MTDTLREELEHGMLPLIRHLNGDQVDNLLTSYSLWLKNSPLLEESEDEISEIELLARFLAWQSDHLGDSLTELRQQYSEYAWQYRHATTDGERQDLMIQFCAQLGFSPKHLSGDRASFELWFGHDAVLERFQRRESTYERDIAFALERLGSVAARILNPLDALWEIEAWKSIGLEAAARRQLSHRGDARVRIEAFRCLSAGLGAIHHENVSRAADEKLIHFVYRAALDRNEETWIQTAALTLLATISPESLDAVLEDRIRKPGDDADIFVRRHLIELLINAVPQQESLRRHIGRLLNDQSPHVRQGFCDQFRGFGPETTAMIVPAVCADPEPCVRAAAVVAIPELVSDNELFPVALSSLLERLFEDKDDLVLRASLKAVIDGHEALYNADQREAAAHWATTLVPAVTQLNTDAQKISVRRWASQTRQRLWVYANPERREILNQLEALISTVKPGSTRSFANRKIPKVSAELLGRVLSVIALTDHGIDISRGLFRTRIARGYLQKFRFWRWWFEFRNPATDKRQAFRHTIGRVFYGTLRAPSAILSELARTKVPGEPLHMGSEDGWRPYLPLVDELISALDHGNRPLRLFTAEGITEILPPKYFLTRLVSRTRLQFRFAQLADLRNWDEKSQSDPKAYIEAAGELGFQIRYVPYAQSPNHAWPGDPAVERFFPSMIPAMPMLPGLPALPTWDQIRDYFFSAYDNNVTQLAFFLFLVFAYFFGRHVMLNREFERSRKKIGFVFGGWGTRGKSGTERIKAALMSALGYSIVSKTTGCEAMFLYSYPFGKVREMFLFRPYDKATIWEQTHIVNITAKLGGEVFLWECMGLSPSYVDVLQRQWMKDDLSTITNTYPDHEDIQGPAGVNIAEVMCNFIPPNGNLVTSEEQMYPILRDGAMERGTPIEGVGWLEAGLLAPDVLERFPYEEHPYNIGLVLACAEHLGVSRDFSLKEMADQVVPDLGVLKTYPKAQVRGRVLEFINGCSANERFGCNNNWTRMGYDTQDVYAQPEVWISTVVNNRADRIPRSRVFADMLADTLYTDRHYLIGTNLDGLQSYIRESWDSFVAKVTLWPEVEGENTERGVAVLESWARKMRIPLVENDVENRLRAMLSGVEFGDADQVASTWKDRPAVESALSSLDEDIRTGILTQLDVDTMNLNEYVEIEKVISASNGGDDVDTKFRNAMTEWYMRRFVVLEDPSLDGEQVVDRICTSSPPGIHNRLMGLQNIKGTGLDFVYRWLAWEECDNALKKLQRRNIGVAREGLSELAGFKEFGLLSDEGVRRVIDEVRSRDFAQDDVVQAELSLVVANLDKRMAEIRAKLGSSTEDSGSGRLTSVANTLESFLDAGDAVKRRKRANRIYKELIAERISLQLAAFELQKLTKRQKGGWLAKQLNDWVSDTFRKKPAAPTADNPAD